MADDKSIRDGTGALFTGAFKELTGSVWAPKISLLLGDSSVTPIAPAVSIADDSAFTPATSRVNPVGFFCDESATDSVDEGDIGIARMTADRKVLVKATIEGQGFKGSAAFTPAASSHTAGDCNGAASDLSLSPAPVSGSVVMITDAELEIDGGTAEATAWRLYLYNVTPPSATADDGAWDLPSGDRTAFLGYIDLGTAVDLGSTQWVETHGVNKTVKLSGTTVFGYLINLTTLTPAAVAHTVKLYGVVL